MDLSPDSTSQRRSYLTMKTLLQNCAPAPSFDLQDGILCFNDKKHGYQNWAVVPHQLQQQLLEQTHRGPFGGHIPGQRTFAKLALHRWWSHMYLDTMEFRTNCPQCATVSGFGYHHKPKPPLRPIPIIRPSRSLGCTYGAT